MNFSRCECYCDFILLLRSTKNGSFLLKKNWAARCETGTEALIITFKIQTI